MKKKNKSRKVELAWQCNEAEDIDKLLLYRGWEEGKVARYKYLDASQNSFVEEIKDHEKVFYRIKPIYFNRKGDFFSEQIEVTLPVKKDKKGE